MKEEFFKKVVEKIGNFNLSVDGLAAILGFAAEHTSVENIFEALVNGPSTITVNCDVLDYYLSNLSYSKQKDCHTQSFKINGVTKTININYTYLGTVYAKEEGNTNDTNSWETSTYKYPVTAIKMGDDTITFDDYNNYEKKYRTFILQNEMNNIANNSKNDATPVEE